MNSSLINFVVLFLLSIIGIFVNPESWNFWAKLAFKLVVVGGIFFFLYQLWGDYQEQEEEEEEDELPDEKALIKDESFFENRAALLARALQKNPEVFELLKKQFSVIWNLILPHNGFLLLMLPKREIILLHKLVRNDVFRSPKNKPIPVLD
ncbi:MAG TPA: hypothetical protein ENL21_08510, partial [Caldithrix abyssi]|nr:hypothetical protein [Caldithrix abyssi]